MARIVYRWRVAHEHFEAFRENWRAATNHIHDTVAGARGSFMMRSAEDEEVVITVAKWDSLASWRAFWGDQDPEQMQAMRALGERLSVEAFEDIEDHTH